jgi:hypothetical protein
VTWGNVKGTSVCNPRRRSALGLQARECLNERANLQNETEWKHQSINQKSSKRKPIIFVYPVKNPKPPSHATFHEGINQSIIKRRTRRPSQHQMENEKARLFAPERNHRADEVPSPRMSVAMHIQCGCLAVPLATLADHCPALSIRAIPRPVFHLSALPRPYYHFCANWSRVS